MIANLLDDAESSVSDLENKLKATLAELVGLIRREGLSQESVERELLSPTLQALLRKCRNGILGSRLEFRLQEEGLGLRMGEVQAGPAPQPETPNPKPQPQTIFATLSKLRGKLIRDPGRKFGQKSGPRSFGRQTGQQDDVNGPRGP